jgi:hypothetical protein
LAEENSVDRVENVSADWARWLPGFRAPGDVVPRLLNIAGRSLKLDIAGASIEAFVCPAFAPMAVAGTTSETNSRLLIWADERYRHPPWGEAECGSIRLPNGGILISHAVSSAVEAFLPEGRLMLWGRPDAFENGDIQAHPASTAIAAWLARSGALVWHAGAVGDDNGAALLIGPGGTGKSTVALACAARGMGVLGDDLCVVTTDGAPMVHGLFSTAKVTRDSEQHLGLTAPANSARTAKDKRVLTFSDETFVRSAPIAAIIVLTKSSSGSVLAPLPRSAVMRALAPTALKAAIGAGSLRQWLRTVADLARRTPGFLVTIDWNLDAVVRSVSSAIAMGRRARTQ